MASNKISSEMVENRETGKSVKEDIVQVNEQLAHTVHVTQFKEFHLDKSKEVYVFDVEHELTRVNQCLVIDEVNEQIFVSQANTFGGDPQESFVITRTSLGGKKLDSMIVRYGGHGTSFGIEVVNGQVFIWSNIQQVNANGDVVTRFLCRYPYIPNGEVNINHVSVLKYIEFPDLNKFMTPFSDNKNGILAIRHTHRLGGGNNITFVTTHRFTDLKSHNYTPLKTYNFTEIMNNSVLQGLALDGDDFYVTFGQHAEDFHLFQINLNNGEIVGELKRPVGLNHKGAWDSDFGEPEGLFLYTDPETNHRTLFTVVVQDATGRRRQKLYAFSWNAGVQKFLGLHGERTQNIKLTRDDGKSKRIGATITKLSDVREAGDYYLTRAESDRMTDHPMPNVSGWWLEVSLSFSTGAIFQRLIRNNTGAIGPETYTRVVSGANVSKWFRTQMVEVD